MIKYILIVSGIFALLVLALVPGFLGPDDLSGCSQPDLTSHCKAADAIIAVSGGDTTSRTNTAISLYKAGWAPKLILSGGAQDTSGPSNASAMKKQAISEGVPQSVIMTEGTSQNTEQNAKNTDSLVQQIGAKRVILVTSVYHQRRAYMEFKVKLGPSVQVVNHPAVVDDNWTRFWWLTPNGWFLALEELGKILYLMTQGITP